MTLGTRPCDFPLCNRQNRGPGNKARAEVEVPLSEWALNIFLSARDGRYAVNASRCDVWVVCACLPVCIVACFIAFWGSVFCW